MIYQRFPSGPTLFSCFELSGPDASAVVASRLQP
jgi:hypothetical protein